MNKATAFLLSIGISSMFVVSCNSEKKAKTTGKDSSAVVSTAEDIKPNDTAVDSTFNINKIAVSEMELGTFPYIEFPKGMVPLNKPLLRDFDKIFFPLEGVMTPVEGRSWKSFVTAENGKEFSLPLFEKSYEEAILKLGAVNVFDGKVSKAELDRINDQATYFGEEGSLNYNNSITKAYVIRRTNGDDVYIQFAGYSAGGAIQILQKEATK
ncbi:hypothetical protein [Sphingobacterium hungaricum]|uniref:Lipoprotein n=1 Tax=Sphingobacterium hungaricum TaxID=2082723 RepID=A0A928V0C3_9SPHI|nr:hypothetical protein [Sphingobacterium hungaricum]MBE8714354.1 hypothetical protein [Sphingobacterium hungaricum]